MITIYYCNDSAQYYKTMILTNLPLGRNVNYDCKVLYKMKRTLQL
jgi:hypothetical protein